jgi:5-hydroxyisourate hydrolase
MIARMTATLTLSVTDETINRPAVGLRFQLYWVEGGDEILLRAGSTNDYGATSAPLLDGAKMSAGVYKLVLHAGDYFDCPPGEGRVLDHVPVVFVIEDASRATELTVRLRPTGYAVDLAS